MRAWQGCRNRSSVLIPATDADEESGKKSCREETCEEVIVPCGDFASAAQSLCGSFSDQIVRHVLEVVKLPGA